MQKNWQQIKSVLENITAIPPLEWLHAMTLFRFRKLAKGEYYVQQGEFFPYIGILLSGSMYSYYETKSGNVGVKRFLQPGDAVAAFPEVVYNLPANYSSKALEPSLIAHMEYKDFLALGDRHPCWDRLARRSLEKEVVRHERKLYSMHMMTAKERYEDFRVKYKKIEGDLPQYLIASYIGITPEALSRIRKE